MFSRRIVGYAIEEHMETSLVLDALQMAVRDRGPAPGLVHHSDRGSQYASEDYQDALRSIGAHCSMSGAGNCYDNAVAESFFATLKEELLYRCSWPSRRRTKDAVLDYIENFYNYETAMGFEFMREKMGDSMADSAAEMDSVVRDLFEQPKRKAKS